MKAYKKIKTLPDGYWKSVKLREIASIIQSCLALYVEAVANDFTATPGQEIELTMEAINRSDVEVELESVTFQPMSIDSVLNLQLNYNQGFKFYKKINLPDNMKPTSPYWLNEMGTLGMHKVEDQLLRGLPETPRDFKVNFKLKVTGIPFAIDVPVVYKKTDPVKGEIYRPFEVTPPVFSQVTEKVYVFC